MFRFRLETLLRLRLAERDQRRAELAKALRAEALLRDELRALETRQIEAAERSRRLKSPGTANVDSLLENHRYEVVLVAQRRQLQQQIVQVEAETERRRQAVVEADRQVRVLEKLRERQTAAWKKETERQEVKQFDELAMVGRSRRQEAPT